MMDGDPAYCWALWQSPLLTILINEIHRVSLQNFMEESQRQLYGELELGVGHLWLKFCF